MSGTPPKIRLRDALSIARTRHASDLHLVAGTPPVLRIDGDLQTLDEPEFGAEELAHIAGFLCEGTGAREAWNGAERSLALSDAELGTLRVHVYPATSGYAIAIRLLAARIPALESLGLPDAVGDLCATMHGLVLVTGPTGSGKSTTLAALVDSINANYARRIVTLEDPIEYRHHNRRSIVTQREIGRDTPNLGEALRGVLRADPDVIVIGEVRDADAVRGMLTAAETGHLVFATMHTGDAVQTIGRIVDVFSGVEQAHVRAQLAHVLVGVLCQHLVRRTQGRGRRAAAELLVATDAVRHLIRESKTHQIRNVMETGSRFGMQTLQQHVTQLVAEREIDPAQARGVG